MFYFFTINFKLTVFIDIKYICNLFFQNIIFNQNHTNFDNDNFAKKLIHLPSLLFCDFKFYTITLFAMFLQINHLLL